MRKLFISSFSSPCLLNPIYRKKLTVNSVGLCVRALEGYTSSNSIQTSHFSSGFLRNNVLRPTKSKTFSKRFFCSDPSSDPNENISLMDTKMIVAPSLLRFLKMNILGQTILRFSDSSIDENIFTKHSKFALVVVSKLLSESRFSELEGLLTEECKTEVQRHVEAMSVGQRASLAVAEDEIKLVFLFDVNTIREEKTYVELTMLYHIHKIVSGTNGLSSKDDKYLVYNCTFLKEVIKGVDCSWIIKAINVCRVKPLFTGLMI